MGVGHVPRPHRAVQSEESGDSVATEVAGPELADVGTASGLTPTAASVLAYLAGPFSGALNDGRFSPRLLFLVPEPGSLVLMIVGVLGAMASARRRN